MYRFDEFVPPSPLSRTPNLVHFHLKKKKHKIKIRNTKISVDFTGVDPNHTSFNTQN